MSNPYRDSRSLGGILMWLGLYLGLGFGVSVLFPFPVSLLVYFILIVIMDFILARRVLKKMGISNVRDLFGRMANPTVSQKVEYFCMNCGFEHREISCPKCGSKMKRVG